MITAKPTSLTGASREVTALLDLCKRVAGTRSTVLITGETGVGKEVVARQIHGLSPRRDKPLVVLDCHGVPATLIESELFGHTRGAFTGAVQSRIGVFERAHGATLLLDEVGEIPLAVQAKLLRILQERSFQRLGSNATFESDVRILATTHHDLRSLVAKGRFREDLFYRLNVFPIHVPPLRQRREDIAPLAQLLVESIARQNRSRQSGIESLALAALVSYHWPGNVRQLQSVLERSLLFTLGAEIRLENLPPEVTEGFIHPEQGETASSLTYAQRLIITRALCEANWNHGKAAAQLGVSTGALRQMMATLLVQRSGED
jgi:Nif-specific regulatory protein